MLCSSSRKILMAATVLFVSLSFSRPALAGGKQKFTGEVGDAMCGRKHMEGMPADCTRFCVQNGSKYALVVGDKIYVLDTSDKAALATLHQHAGKNVTVTGTLKGDTIEVSSITVPK